MRQKANGGLPRLGQKTPNASGETESEVNIVPVAFNLNQSSAVCLPLVSDTQRLIWVHSNDMNLQLDCEAELDKAFDRFPYLTQKQTAALARRCSLHPDQVKVWFMVQRLRYGISWDYGDIPTVRGKVKSSLEKEVKENKKCKRGLNEPGGKKVGEVVEQQSACEGRMMGENVMANEQLVGNMKQEQPVEKEKDKRSTQKKRKRTTVTEKTGKKMLKQGEEGGVERAEEVRSDEAVSACEKSTQPTKTQTQMELMRKAFSHCQYPDKEDYDRLAKMIDFPRHVLVQWFGDMRYYIKKVKPGWMSEEQHSRALTNVRYQQCMKALLKTEAQDSKSEDKETRIMKHDESES